MRGDVGGPVTSGRVEALHIAPTSTEAVEPREAVEAVSGRGLRGDRYFGGRGTFSGGASRGRDLTLIEAEAIEAIAREADVHLDPGAHRRNVTTRGVALNHLAGDRFRVGEALCEGVRLCEPCDHLESLTEPGVREALIHRGGLRADVIETGEIAVGDLIERA